MPRETVDGLNVKSDGIYVDATLGGGGHASLILERLTDGVLIGIDRDEAAINFSRARFEPCGKKFILIRENHINIKKILSNLSIEKIDGFLLDLGVSSRQLDEPSRGFSYMSDSRPDMRMDLSEKLNAYDIINAYGEKRLANIIFLYGEERYAKQIARAIVTARIDTPISSTSALSNIILKAIPPKARRFANGHPSMRTFQAIRIEVNNELTPLAQLVRDAADCLKESGRLCAISFHSLEDRIIKNMIKKLSSPCECPRDVPVCVCNKKPELKIITRKPITPSEEELAANKRAHSGKLRIAERTEF